MGRRRKGKGSAAVWAVLLAIVACIGGLGLRHGGAQGLVERLQTDPQWSELPAVQAGQLIPFAGDLHSWDQPDTRWGLGLLWLATQIQPEHFADVDIEAEAVHFFETYYGLERATVDAELLSLLAASQVQR